MGLGLTNNNVWQLFAVILVHQIITSISLGKDNSKNGFQTKILKYLIRNLKTCQDTQHHGDLALTYLQPYYGNGVFGNVYLQVDNTRR